MHTLMSFQEDSVTGAEQEILLVGRVAFKQIQS